MDTNKEQPVIYDTFPRHITFMRQLILFLWVIAGMGVFVTFGIYASMLFLTAALVLIGFVLYYSCRNCRYHGHNCDTGLSRLASLFFKQGQNDEEFVKHAPKFTIPMLALISAPLIAGLINLVVRFNTPDLLWVLVYSIGTVLVALTSKHIACPHCKMQDICPLCFVKKTG